mmetsp:Transcript_26693/g.73410  ORF Transcript_26693/g.73410 Transcript_26693/m.73410 type:complete len:162 (+) Transcript_26693:89-574(+)
MHSKRIILTMRSFLVLLLCVLAVSGADLEVTDWVVPPKSDPYYPSMDAFVGDTITFTWIAGITDVHIHPTGNCDEDGAILVGYQSGASYTFTEDDAGKEMFFASDVGRRCEAGQNVKVAVAGAAPVNGPVSAIETVDSAANGNRFSWALALATGVVATLSM